MKILILGSNGFVGKHILNIFTKKHNFEISTLNKEKAYNKKFYSLKANISLNSFKISKFKNLQFDLLIDCGWEGVFGSFKNSKKQNKNKIYTTNLIKILKICKIKSIISFGSQAEYGNHNIQINEKTFPKPETLYGKIKLWKLNILNNFCKKNKIRFVWFRIFSIFGPRENYEWLIPYVINKLLRKRIVHLTKGTQKWDYLYIEDLVRAVYMASLDKRFSGIYNLASGKSHSISFIVKKIAKLLKSKETLLKFGRIDYQKIRTESMYANINKINRLGWKPKVNLENGLKKTINYYKSLL
jgi:nucleoside-diphosphate-sugar epimerase